MEKHLIISGSSDFMSSENRYGGLLTRTDTGPQRLSRVSESDNTKGNNPINICISSGISLMLKMAIIKYLSEHPGDEQ